MSSLREKLTVLAYKISENEISPDEAALTLLSEEEESEDVKLLAAIIALQHDDPKKWKDKIIELAKELKGKLPKKESVDEATYTTGPTTKTFEPGATPGGGQHVTTTSATSSYGWEDLIGPAAVALGAGALALLAPLAIKAGKFLFKKGKEKLSSWLGKKAGTAGDVTGGTSGKKALDKIESSEKEKGKGKKEKLDAKKEPEKKEAETKEAAAKKPEGPAASEKSATHKMVFGKWINIRTGKVDPHYKPTKG